MNKLKELRDKSGLTLRELENEVGIANSTLSEIETGKRRMGPKHAKILAPYFGVSEKYIMGDDAIKINVRVKPSTSIRAYDFEKDEWKPVEPEGSNIDPANFKGDANQILDRYFDEVVQLSIDKKLDDRTRLIYLISSRLFSDDLSIKDLEELLNHVDYLIWGRE